MSIITPEQAGGANVCAFLDMLASAAAEGTASDRKTQNDGYDVIVGGGIFTDYSDHPRQLIHLKHADGTPILQPNGQPLNSTCAGRYQIKEAMFDAYKLQLNLPDFSPLSQDKIAVQMMKECHAVSRLAAGDIQGAVVACNSRWASLPGNSYGQRQGTITALVEAYQSAGGLMN